MTNKKKARVRALKAKGFSHQAAFNALTPNITVQGTPMRRCIYCLEEKDPTFFTGREHVMLQSFGLFDGKNFVLKCVCDACNKFFGDTIDLKLARDSIEAIGRIHVGLKSAAEYESLGKRSTSRVEFMEGPMAGGWGYNIANPNGEVIGMMAFPQVWFAKSADGPWDRFRVDLDEVPTKDELIARGYEKGGTVHIRSFEVTDMAALLTAKGFDLAQAEMGETPTPDPGTRLRAETVGKITHPEYRAVTKIALNYLAAVVGSKEALLPSFDNARNYARYGEQKARVRVYPHENPWFPGRKGHYISLSRIDDMIVAQLSILLQVQYFIVLAENAASIPFKSAAHFFDLSTRKIVEIEPLRIVRGRPLKKIDAASAPGAVPP